MIKKMATLCLLFVAFAGFSTKTKASSLTDEVRRFFSNVTHNPHYVHFLTIGSAICTYNLLKNAFVKNNNSLHDFVVKVLSVVGAGAVSKVVNDYPNQTSLLCLGAVVFHLLKRNGFVV